MNMSCGRARRLLWPSAGPREATGEVVAAREHVSGCEGCRGFLDDMQRIGDRIARVAPRPTAPADVRDRLFQRIAQARGEHGSPARVTWARRMIPGAAALLLVGIGVLGYMEVRGRSAGDSGTLGSIVEDRLRSQQGAGLVSSDSLQVAQWLAERLPFAVQIPIFPGARLTGARLLVANRHAGAVVEYLVEDRGLTYYVLPGDLAGPRQEVHLASQDGYRVASWHDGGLTHALAGMLPGSRLLELARYCIHQMMA